MGILALLAQGPFGNVVLAFESLTCGRLRLSEFLCLSADVIFSLCVCIDDDNTVGIRLTLMQMHVSKIILL